MPRSVVIERVKRLCGVDITVAGTESDVQRAINALVQIKESGLDCPATPGDA